MPKRRPNEERIKAVELFERGFGSKYAAKKLRISRSVVQQWLYTYRALGKEALLSSSHRKYTQEQKLAAVLDLLEGGLSIAEVMERHGVRSKTQILTWRRAYEEGGADALAPKPKGRPRGCGAKPKEYQTELERLRAENERLRCELEVQKRLNALAERQRRGGRRPR